MKISKADRGACSEAIFLYYAYSRGWNVTAPTFNQTYRYDFVITAKEDGEACCERVQVKSAYLSHNGRGTPYILVELSSNGVSGRKRYLEGDFDWFFVVDDTRTKGERMMAWIFPWEVVKDIKKIYPHTKKWDKYKSII